MDLKAKLLERGMKLLQDDRVMKVIQDERVMKTVMQAMELRGKVQQSVDEGVAKVAKSLNLATQQEVGELKRTIRKLEREVERSKAPPPGGNGSHGNGHSA